MLDFLVAGVPALVVIGLFVEAIKRLFKVEGDAAIPLAVVVGVVLALANQAVSLWPAFAAWYQPLAAGVLLGLAGCGLFDVGQAIKAKVFPSL